MVRQAAGVFHVDRDAAVALARQAMEAAQAEGDLATCSQACGLLADAERLAGRMESAFELAQQAVRHAKAAGDLEAEADAVNNLGAQAWSRGEFDLAAHWFEEALRLREELGKPGDIAAACNNLGLSCCEKGDLATGLSYLQRSLEIRERIGDKFLAETHLNLGVLYVDLGDWDKALESYFRVMAELERSENKEHMALCYNNVAELYLRRGKIDRAMFHLEQALDIATQARIPFARATVLGMLGEAAFAAGDHGRAQGYYEQCRQTCLDCDNRKELAQTLRRWAELDLANGDLREARNRLDDALALCMQAGTRKELGNVRRVSGELLREQGDVAGAVAALRQSVDTFRTLGSSYELACSLLALGRLLAETEQDGQELLGEAREIFRVLGIARQAEEVGRLLRPAVVEKKDVGLVQELTELACAQTGLDGYCHSTLELLCRRLPLTAAAILLRDGGVYRRGDDAEPPEEGGETRLALEVGGVRVGTLLLRGDIDAGQVRPLAGPVALGVAAARREPTAPPGTGMPAPGRFSDIVGAETTLCGVIDTVERVAPTTATVLLLGESGTGKEVIARMLHGLSDRASGPFVAVNCAAIPETLLESELFGIEKGTATGVAARQGKFEAARGGTVFLDEIADMNLTLQAKMLRVLENRSVERIGSRKPVEIDVRVVAATNRDLAQAIENGEFRLDLFYRLNVISISLPALRDRRSDIPAFVGHFLAQFSREYGRQVSGITEDCMTCLMRCPWEGNVRELKNVIERAVLMTHGDSITDRDLPAGLQGLLGPGPDWREVRRKARSSGAAPVEQNAIVAVLEQCDWVVQRAAVQLGISRTHLYRMMRKHGISRTASRPG